MTIEGDNRSGDSKPLNGCAMKKSIKTTKCTFSVVVTDSELVKCALYKVNRPFVGGFMEYVGTS